MTADEVLEELKARPKLLEECTQVASDPCSTNNNLMALACFALGGSMEDREVAVLRSVLRDPLAEACIRAQRELEARESLPNPNLPQEKNSARARLPVNRSPDESVRGKSMFRRPDHSWVARYGVRTK